MSADVLAGIEHLLHAPMSVATLPVYNGAYFEKLTRSPPAYAGRLIYHQSYPMVNLYDVFVFLNSGTIGRFAAGPAWTSTSAPPAPRLHKWNGFVGQ